MSDPTDSRGRRANGLPATDWGALVDLDPRLSEGLLDRLAAAGVAAYVEPATAVDTVHRAVTMPSRPMDRLWVDPSRADSAREVVASEVADLTALLAEDDPGATAHGLVHAVPRYAARRVLSPPALPGPALPGPALPGPALPDAALTDPALPGPTQPATADSPGSPGDPAPAAPLEPPPATSRPRSDDDVFAELVASFHRRDDEVARVWPAAEDIPEPGPPAPPAPPAAAGPAPGPAPGPALRRRTDLPEPAPQPRDWAPPEGVEDDGHFVPPPPPPVPRIRLRTLLSLLAVVLGVVVLFAPQVFGLTATYGVGIIGLLLLAGGAAALVWSMHEDADSGPDDGAVV